MIIVKNLFGFKENEIDEPFNYIGTDESGKGDFFGPLVVAGVLGDKQSLIELKKIEVKDSKELTDSVINKLAGRIKNLVKGKYEIIAINPAKYNELYSKIGNLNRLLGWAHAKVLENILEKHGKPVLGEISIYVQGIGSGRDAAIHAISGRGINIVSLRDITPVPHNGCRPRKARRV